MNYSPVIKTIPTTYQDLRKTCLPIKTSQNIRRSHSIRCTREIPRLGWRRSDAMIAEHLRVLERNRSILANYKFVSSDVKVATIHRVSDR